MILQVNQVQLSYGIRYRAYHNSRFVKSKLSNILNKDTTTLHVITSGGFGLQSLGWVLININILRISVDEEGLTNTEG